MKTVFLSYARKDDDFVAPLYTALLEHRHELDVVRDTQGGMQDPEDYQTRIEDAMRAADLVLVVWTPQSSSSAWVHFEAAIGWWNRSYLGVVQCEVGRGDPEVEDIPWPYRRASHLGYDGTRSSAQNVAQFVRDAKVRKRRRVQSVWTAAVAAGLGLLGGAAIMALVWAANERDAKPSLVSEDPQAQKNPWGSLLGLARIRQSYPDHSVPLPCPPGSVHQTGNTGEWCEDQMEVISPGNYRGLPGPFIYVQDDGDFVAAGWRDPTTGSGAAKRTGPTVMCDRASGQYTIECWDGSGSTDFEDLGEATQVCPVPPPWLTFVLGETLER